MWRHRQVGLVPGAFFPSQVYSILWYWCSHGDHQGPFLLTSTWISNHTPSKVCNEITYPFPNFNGCTIEVWEWISNLWCYAWLGMWLLIHVGNWYDSKNNSLQGCLYFVTPIITYDSQGTLRVQNGVLERYRMHWNIVVEDITFVCIPTIRFVYKNPRIFALIQTLNLEGNVSNLIINIVSAADLTLLPLDKMAAISQTIFSEAFSWMKNFVF